MSSDRRSPASHLHCRASRWRLHPMCGSFVWGNKAGDLKANLVSRPRGRHTDLDRSISWPQESQIRQTHAASALSEPPSAPRSTMQLSAIGSQEIWFTVILSTGALLVLGTERGHGKARQLAPEKKSTSSSSRRGQERRQRRDSTSPYGHHQATGPERPYRRRSDDFGLIFTGDCGAIMKHGWSGTHGSVVGK